MELNGEVAIDAPRERVWAALNDAKVLRECIPGCEEVIDESPTERRARVMVKVGPVRARFNGKVSLSEVEAPQRCVMGFEGSGGAAGMASGRSQVELHEDGTGTRLTYTVKASVGGKLGQIGGRMIDASAKQLADQFFAALQAHVAPRTAESLSGVPDEVAPGVTAPAAIEAAAQGAGLEVASARLPMAPLHPASAGLAIHMGESTRVLWFVLGAASTGVGVWLGRVLF